MKIYPKNIDQFLFTQHKNIQTLATIRGLPPGITNTIFVKRPENQYSLPYLNHFQITFIKSV